MILIRRGTEPEELPTIRADELGRVEVIRQTGRFPDSDDFGNEYKIVREELRSRQHFKCCYCEKFDEIKYTTVEHVRPKAKAKRSRGRVELGYWWLAWSWENLLFCCEQCNGHKGIWFPIRGDDQPPHFGRPLTERSIPPGHEKPILLDPTQDDGIAHIQFRPVSGRWVPQPRAGSIRGYETILRAQLDRSSLLELYDVVVTGLDDSITRITEAMTQAGQPPSRHVSDIWREVMRRQLRPSAPLVALHYDVLDHRFPKMVRLRWGVSLDEFAAAITHRRTGA